MARVITAPGIVRNVSKYLNSMRRVPFAIGKDDWTEVDSSTYTYEFVTAYVTTSSFDIGTFDNSVRSYAKGDISMEKKNGGGGMVFTTTKRPTGTVSGSIYIWDNNDNKVPVILEDTVVPIENGGTDATSVPGMLSNLGLGSANDAQETLEFGDAVHEDVANNVTTTSEGYVLDARQGKVLKDSVTNISESSDHGFSNINELKAGLLTVVSGMQGGQTCMYNAYVTSSSDTLAIQNGVRYEGHITVQYKSTLEFTWIASNRNGHITVFAYNNGTWKTDSIALNSKLTPESVSTGITGVSADKIGSIVILRIGVTTSIGDTSAGWKLIGELPVGLRPASVVDFVGYDNAASGVETTQIRITTAGNINVWLPANKYAKPFGTVTYTV